MDQLMEMGLLSEKNASINDVDEELEENGSAGTSQTSNSIGEMNDSMGDGKEAATAETQAPQHQVPDTNTCSADIREVDDFLQSPELQSKKNSKDGYMNAVEREARKLSKEFAMLRNTLPDMNEEKKRSASYSLASQINLLANEAKEYVENKNPWFSKGKKRKARVQKLYDIYSVAYKSADIMDLYLRTLTVESGLVGMGTQIEEGSDAAISRDRNKEYNRLSNQLSQDYVSTMKGIGKTNQKLSSVNNRTGGAYLYGMKEIGGYTQEEAENDVALFLGGDVQRDQKSKIASYERFFDMICNEDMSQYLFDSFENMSSGDLRRKQVFLNMAWESEGIRNAYEQMIKDNVPGLKYNEKDMVEIGARIAAYQSLANIYRAFGAVVADPLYDEVGPNFFKLMKAKHSDLAGDLVNDLQFDDGKGYGSQYVKYVDIIMKLSKINLATQGSGFRPGISVEEFLAENRKFARERMQKLGFSV